jgi:hypothetical protein
MESWRTAATPQKAAINEPTSFFDMLAYAETSNHMAPMRLLAHKSKIGWKDSEKAQTLNRYSFPSLYLLSEKA